MSQDYKKYLMAKNSASQSNLKVYKAKYETAIGKLTPEEGQQMLELNDNIIDEEQISNELRDLIRKYVPNLQYLDQVLNDPRLTDQMKYDLYLNFGTFVEPKINAIRNRKLSIEKFVAFLMQLAKDLSQSGLTQDISDKVNKLTNVFRSQINDYEADQAGLSQQDLANSLVASNIQELEKLGITETSVDGQTTNAIKLLIRQLMHIDRLLYNFERVKNKVNPDSSGQLLTDAQVNGLSLPVSKSELRRFYDNYFNQITDPIRYYEVPFRGLQKAYEFRMKFYDNPQQPGQQPIDANDEDDEEAKLNLKAGLPKDYIAPSLVESLPRMGNHDLNDVNQQFENIFSRIDNESFMRMREGKQMYVEDLQHQIEKATVPITKKQREINAFKKAIAEIESSNKEKLSKREKNERAYLRKQLAEREKELLILEQERQIIMNEKQKVEKTMSKKVYDDINKDMRKEYKHSKDQQNVRNANTNNRISQNQNMEWGDDDLPQPSNNNIGFRTPRRVPQSALRANNNNIADTPDTLLDEVYDGRGLLRKVKTTNNGKTPALSQYEQPLVNNKYFINRKKLNANVLEIRYTKNRHLIPIKSQIVGKKLRLLIETIIDENQLDKQKYETLTKMEQNLLRSLLPYLGRDIDEVDDDEAFYDRFDVIRGELLSGNDNKALKREAKQYLMHALNTGKISRTHFNQMLIDLDL